MRGIARNAATGNNARFQKVAPPQPIGAACIVAGSKCCCLCASSAGESKSRCARVPAHPMHVWRRGDQPCPQLRSRSCGLCPLATADLVQPSRRGLVQPKCFNGPNSGSEVATALHKLASVPVSSGAGQSVWSAKGDHCGRTKHQTERVAIQLCVMLRLSLQPGQTHRTAGDYKDLPSQSVSSTLFAAAHVRSTGPVRNHSPAHPTKGPRRLACCNIKVNRRGRPSGFRGGDSTCRASGIPAIARPDLVTRRDQAFHCAHCDWIRVGGLASGMQCWH